MSTHLEIAKEIYLDLLVTYMDKYTAEELALRAVAYADAFMSAYSSKEKKEPKVEDCYACFGTGGKRNNPCEVCAGTGKIVII